MKLQLALDELTLPEALVFIDKVVDDVDIIEVGTPFLIREGVNAIKVIKEKYPHKEVLVDAKIMDGGHFESQLLFDAGADYVTVLGVTDLLTISHASVCGEGGWKAGGGGYDLRRRSPCAGPPPGRGGRGYAGGTHRHRPAGGRAQAD